MDDLIKEYLPFINKTLVVDIREKVTTQGMDDPKRILKMGTLKYVRVTKGDDHIVTITFEDQPPFTVDLYDFHLDIRTDLMA